MSLLNGIRQKHSIRGIEYISDLEDLVNHFETENDDLQEKVERYEKALKEITQEGCYDASCEKGVIATKVLFE